MDKEYKSLFTCIAYRFIRVFGYTFLTSFALLVQSGGEWNSNALIAAFLSAAAAALTATDKLVREKGGMIEIIARLTGGK